MRYPNPPESLVVSRRQLKSDGRKRIVDTIIERARHAAPGLGLLSKSSGANLAR
jgi:hypothetical protein